MMEMHATETDYWKLHVTWDPELDDPDVWIEAGMMAGEDALALADEIRLLVSGEDE